MGRIYILTPDSSLILPFIYIGAVPIIEHDTTWLRRIVRSVGDRRHPGAVVEGLHVVLTGHATVGRYQVWCALAEFVIIKEWRC